MKRKLAEKTAARAEKNGVPDTAYDCPILRIGVACEKPVTKVRDSLQKWSISDFLHSLSTHHKTTVISRFLFWKMPQGKW